MQRLIDTLMPGQYELEHLKSASTFGALSDAAIMYLMQHGRLVLTHPDEVLFSSHQPGDSFYIVLDGQVDYYREVADGGRVLIRKCGFGDQMGYVSMIGLQERLGKAITPTPSRLLEIDSDLFYQLHLDYPSDFGILMLNLARDMARTIRLLAQRLAESEAARLRVIS